MFLRVSRPCWSVTFFGLVNVILHAAQFNIDLIPLLLKAALSSKTVSDSTQSLARTASLVEAQDTDGQAFVH